MDKDALISSAEVQLKSFGKFLDEFDAKLSDLTNKIDTSKQCLSTKKLHKPIKIQSSANREKLTILKLIESDNKILNKTILTFAHLCDEAETVSVEAHQLQAKFLYYDEELCTFDEDQLHRGGGKGTEKCLIKISNCMEFLCQMQFAIHRCIVLASNLLHQSGAFLSLNKQPFTMQFSAIFNGLSKVVLQLVKFDEVLSHSNFHKYWSSYKKTIESVGMNLDKFTFCSETEINGLVNVLNELEFLFSGNLFQSFLDSTFLLKEKITPKALGQLSSNFQDYIKSHLTIIEKLPADLSEFHETELLIKLNAICALSHNFFGQIDQKSFKQLLEFNCKHMGITLMGNVIWNPDRFLKKHAETLVRQHEKYLHDAMKLRQIYLQNKVQSLQKDCKSYCAQITLFTLQIDSAFKTGAQNLKIEQFKQLSKLFLQGYQYAGQLSHIVKSLTNLHVLLRAPMTKSTLLAICKLLEYLQMIQTTFQSDMENVLKITTCIVQYLQYRALYIILAAKKKITKETLNDRNLDTLSALKIAEKCLSGPATRTRILVASLAVNVTNASNGALNAEQHDKFTTILNRMVLLSDFQDNLEKICDTSFIYWHQSLLSVYLKQIVDKRCDYYSFQYIIKAFNDSGHALDHLNLSELKLAEIFKKSNLENFKSEIVSNLCAKIELFLRLEVHSNLQLDKVNPFEQGTNDHRDLIAISPLEMNGRLVILKDHIENYLSCMFYNLTTISLHDWKTYEEMRQLANYKLNLNPINDYLPTQTLEQGIDVLEIMRNIHIFVSKYLYNMNTQIFVEQSSQNKHLNTIGIRHIANSLRTHGTGIINTTVNFTYQFLRQKFYTFSQFLYDEQIKSRLMKEMRHFMENKQNTSYKYSYERADNFNKDVRKLGLSADGQSYMDLFRKVITHIGNAMGYIRLIRSGSIHANYSASLYLPRFDENLKFVELVKNDGLGEVTQNAAQNLETNIENLSKRFSEGTDYFKLLINAFNPFFRNPNNMHLKTFYLIVPAVTLNYIEYILSVKDKIHKKDKQEAILFDDGFAMGLAYILKLLDQMTDFDSLHWFTSINERFNAEHRKISKMRQDATSGASKKDDKLQQTLALTEKRISSYQMECNLLFFSLNSAKIFFQ